MRDLETNNIFITHQHNTQILELVNKSNYSRICILVDENTKEHCLPLIDDKIKSDALIIEIKSGEENKHLETCTHIWQQMTDAHLDRKALVLNLGGGVIGDMGGFCASTYKRGIDFIQVPTTLLSQVDASVGGKLGIDFHTFKNHIGVFRVPNAVIINTDFLKTLPNNELRSGYAEVIKHCLIADEKKWLEISTKTLDSIDLDDIVKHSVLVKADVVENDPTEKGLRKILNFGHTIGHAIESFYLPTPKKLLHGEAIGIGMITEAYVAHQKGYITLEDVTKIKKYILQIFGHPKVDINALSDIVSLTIQDKKNENNVVLSSLLEKTGQANFNIPLTENEIIDSIHYYNA